MSCTQIGAADCILGKIGYGAVSEALAHRKPLIFVRRDFFNEEPFLRKQLEIHDMAVEIKKRDFLQGSWQPFLLSALKLKPTFWYVSSLTSSCRFPAVDAFDGRDLSINKGHRINDLNTQSPIDVVLFWEAGLAVAHLSDVMILR